MANKQGLSSHATESIQPGDESTAAHQQERTFLQSNATSSFLRFDPRTVATSVEYFPDPRLFISDDHLREKSLLGDTNEQQGANMNYGMQNVMDQTGSGVSPNLAAAAAVAVLARDPSTSYQYYVQSQGIPGHGFNQISPDHIEDVSTTIMSLQQPQEIVSSSMDASQQGDECERMESQSLSAALEQDQGDLGIGSSCLICGDRATGKHYGAYSCDGCKGFFRRSVRRNHSYTCRHKRMCVITKDKRNQCRFCRLCKCFRVGMKKSAVQNERDKISNRPLLFDAANSGQSILDLQQLLQAESRANCIIHDNYIEQKHTGSSASCIDGQESGFTLADRNDICESIKTQLIFLIEWAKNLPSFGTLTMNDQIALLQSHAAEMLILGVVWRSLCSTGMHRSLVTAVRENSGSVGQSNSAAQTKNVWLPTESTAQMSSTPPAGISSSSEVPLRSQTGDTNSKPSSPRSSEDPPLLLLGNSRIISVRSSHPDIAEVARQTVEQLYQPMQDLCLEDAEIACLRAIVFFDPNCPDLTDSGRNLVRSCQYQIQLELMHLMNDKLYLPQGRFGALLLLLPDLRTIANHMVDKLQLAKKMGLTRLDGLLTEILLSNTCNTEAKTPTTDSVPAQPEEQCKIFQDSTSAKAKQEPPRNSPKTYTPTLNVSMPMPVSEQSRPGERTTDTFNARNLISVPNSISCGPVSVGATAFLPYVPRTTNSLHAVNLSQHFENQFMSPFVGVQPGRATLTAWSEVSSARSAASGMLEYCNQPIVDSSERPVGTDNEGRPSFLVHLPQESFEIQSSVNPAECPTTPNQLQISDISAYDNRYYTTCPPGGNQQGLCADLGVPIGYNSHPFPTRVDFMPLVNNVISTMFATEPQQHGEEQQHYAFYHGT